MRNQVEPRSKRCRRAKKAAGRPTIGIRELKARASAIIEDVKDRRTSYAVTKRGEVEALELAPADVPAAYLADARWLHVTGCNLAITESARDACYTALRSVPAGATVSFDPNIRPGALTMQEIRELCRPAIVRADVILPSLSEAAMLTGAATDEAGCRMWAAQGKTVVLKMGAQGCRVFARGSDFVAPSFPVEEVDPTGAGDSFCAGLTVAMLDGMALPDAARFANAVGALAVTKKGPMEGAPWRTDVDNLLAAYPRQT